VDVAVAIAEALDDAGDKIRGGFRDDGGPLLKDGIDPMTPAAARLAPMTVLKRMAIGIERTLRKKLPTITARGNPRKAL
jgi:hypothetical protein